MRKNRLYQAPALLMLSLPTFAQTPPDTALTDTAPLIADTPVSPSPDLDITTAERVTISPPAEVANSARTRQDIPASDTALTKQQTSLARLKTFYQPTTATPSDAQKSTAMCTGSWVYPQTSDANTPTDYQHNAQNAAKTDKPNSEFPLYAQADYGYYDNENYAELSGNVQLNQGRQLIAADKVVVNLQDGIAAAQGNVMLVDTSQPTADNLATDNTPTDNGKAKRPTSVASKAPKGGLITVADEIAYQSDTSKATAKDVAFASVPLQAHGYAKQLNKVDDSHYQIDDVMFTTCAPDNPTWQINAKNIDLNTDTGRGEAYNATLKIKNIPVLRLPYFNFPIDDRRTSGFLLPRAGFNSDGGLNVQLPYYFNLAPNYDATLTPRIYTNRNPMLMGEFRYLTENYGAGDLSAAYLPRDKQYFDKDRSRVFFNHHWQSERYPTLSADAVYQYLSDGAYFNDFDTLGSVTNRLNLPRRLQVNYYTDYLNALAKVESYQTLDKNLTADQQVKDKDKPYYRLPQLSVNYRIPQEKLPWQLPITVTGVSDYAYFKRPINDGSAPEQSGGRLYNKLTATYPLTRPWGYVTPSVSLQHLYTQFDQKTLDDNGIGKDNKSQSVFVPEISVDSGLNFYKTGSPLGKFDQTLGGYQLISPRLKYVYAPYRDQSQVPNFNTRLASLNFPQLYENSWFLGYDRLPDSHHLTPSLNYRYIDNQGQTRLDASIAQQFYLDDIRVHLNNTNTPMRLNSSGTVVQVSAQPRQDVGLDLDGAVSDNAELSYVNTQLRYMPTPHSLYNLGYVKRNANPLGQQDLSAVTASAIFPIKDNWRFLGALQYDNQQSRFSEILVGFNYESCCYGFSVYGRRYYDELNDTGKANQAIMAELSLSGVTSRRDGQLGSLINNRVLGYRQLDNF